MMDDQVLGIVNRANQRGGRMLSVVDLVEAGTLTADQVGWLLGRIMDDASWLVGARPGGAGKTTIMAALMTMLPEGTVMRLTVGGTSWREARAGECVVAYEISPGRMTGYVWGEAVKAMTELGLRGVRLVANVHADTIAQAQAQIVRDCGASDRGMGAFDLFLPIGQKSVFDRTPEVQRIFEYRDGTWQTAEIVLNARAKSYRTFVETCLGNGTRTVEDVRDAWLAWDDAADPVR